MSDPLEEVYLDKLGLENGHLVCGLSSPKGGMLHMVAEAFWREFKGAGAINFLEITASHPKAGDFVVTMQRKDGETPAQQRDKARAKAVELEDMLKVILSAFEGVVEENAGSIGDLSGYCLQNHRGIIGKAHRMLRGKEAQG